MIIDAKESKNNNCGDSKDMEEDRLSSLPDAILVDILSRLTIHLAATTTILSHRWNGLWNQVTSVRLDTNTFARDSFALTLGKVLNCFHSPIIDDILNSFTANGCSSSSLPGIYDMIEKLNSPVINSLQIYVPLPQHWSFPWRFYQWYFTDWIKQMFGRCVIKKFKMRFEKPDGGFRIMIPLCVVQCQFLVELELDQWCGCQWLGGENLRLPKLKKLVISSIDSPIVCRLIKSSPLLEHLELQVLALLLEDNHVIDISAQNLKRLFIRTKHSINNLDVTIDAPKLEHVWLWDIDCITKYCFLKKLNNLVDVTVCQVNYSNHLVNAAKTLQLLRAMSSVTELSIVGHGPTSKVDGTLPIFNHLTCLNVFVLSKEHWKGLIQILRYMPNLSRLGSNIKIKGIGGQEVEDEDTMNWVEHDPVPSCLSTKVKGMKLIITSVNGVKHELEVLRYILRVANVLKTLKIVYVTGPETKQLQRRKEVELSEELYKFPRSSSLCEITIQAVTTLKFVPNELWPWNLLSIKHT